MIRNLKLLGLALMAVFAMGAVLASAASAQGKLTSDGLVTLSGTETGVEQNRLTAFAAFVECPGSTYVGHAVNGGLIPSGSTTATLTPNYKQTSTDGKDENCKGPFGWSATVDPNGCDFVVHLGATTGGVAGTYGVTFDVVCPGGNEITVTLWTSKADHTKEIGGGLTTPPFCILHVPAQTGLIGAHATSTGNDIDLTGTVEGITVKRTEQAEHPSPVLCKTETTTTGKFDLDVTATGLNGAGGATGISLSD